MKRIGHSYEVWEDFLHGMYNEEKEGREQRIEKAIECLTDLNICYEYMKRVSVEWKNACEQTFTNPATNHQSFLGQCACSLYAGVHEDETREAWGKLSNIQRYAANGVADKVYKEWRKEHNEENAQLKLF